jgi:hypothetical protein
MTDAAAFRQILRHQPLPGAVTALKNVRQQHLHDRLAPLPAVEVACGGNGGGGHRAESGRPSQQAKGGSGGRFAVHNPCQSTATEFRLASRPAIGKDFL